MVKKFAQELYGLVDSQNEEALKTALAALEVKETPAKKKFGVAMLEDGETLIFFPGDALVDGTPVFEDEELSIPVQDGEYVTSNGDTITVVQGLAMLTPVDGEPEEAPVEDAPEEEVPEAPADEEEVLEEVPSSTPTSIKETTTVETNFEAEAPSQVEAEVVEENLEGEKSMVEQILEALAPKFAEYDTLLASLTTEKEEVEAEVQELSKQKEAVEAKNEKLSKAAAATPYTESKGNAKSYAKKSGFAKAQESGRFKQRNNK